jgi:hypothetical protein
MITEEDFYRAANARPELIRAFCNAVNAVIDLRKEAAARQPGPWAGVRLKEKQAAATLLITQFADGLVFNGRPLSEDEKTLAQSWIMRAADFHLQRKEERAKLREPGATPVAPPDAAVQRLFEDVQISENLETLVALNLVRH